jgi:shikimate kinase
MGSGKSAVGRVLSDKIAISFYDLDELIAQNEQKSIAELFKSKGEVYFRKKESQVFRDFLTSNNHFVLALGGGTPCYANNHELLKQSDILSVYLKTSVDVLMERLKGETQQRPLIANLSDEDLKEYINKHLFDRNYYYHQAKFTIHTDGKSKEEIAAEIQSLLGL